MTRKIQHRRGLEANIVALDEGELGFTTDTKKLFVGTAAGNKEFLTQASLDELNDAKADFRVLEADYALDKPDIDKIPQIQEDIMSRGIIESGYIENSGFYQKFGDGSMEIWGKQVIAGAFNTGDDASFTIPFMDGFIEPPVVLPVASAYHGNAAFDGFRVSIHLNGINLGNFFGHVHIDYAESVIGSIDVNYMIKGRWRAGFLL